MEKAGDAIDWAALDAESDLPILVEQFLTQFYGEQAALDPGAGSEAGISAVPKEVLVPVLPANATEIQAWLSKLRGGSQVQLRVPQRGDKKDLAETVQRNAKEALAQHKLKRAGDFTSRSAALQGIQEALDLDSAPLRIECIDISHVQGTDVVASLVVFEDGSRVSRTTAITRSRKLPATVIPTTSRVSRRSRVGGSCATTATWASSRRRRRPWTDGGDLLPKRRSTRRRAGLGGSRIRQSVCRGRRRPPSGHGAAAVLDELGVTDVAVVGLAKRLEEVWVPGGRRSGHPPRTSESLYLLQRIRDEAHRFAITFHRSKRSRRMTASALDSVKGLGETRRTALVAHFGSVAKLKTATVEEIMQVPPGIGETTATAVLAALGTDSAAATRVLKLERCQPR